MNYFRGLLLILSGAAGVVLGRWMMKEQAGSQQERLADHQPATQRGASTAKSGKPTAPGTEPNFEEAVTESNLLQLWKLRDNEATLEAFVNYAGRNPARAIDLAMTLEGPGLSTFIEKLVQRMPESGEGVMDGLLRHEKFWRPSPLLDEIFTACARVNPGRAWREALAQSGPVRGSVVDAVARGWAQKSPQDALTLAQSLPKPEHREVMMREALLQWAMRDGTALMAWVKSQPRREDLKEMVRWDRLRLNSQKDFLTMMEMVPTESLGGAFCFQLWGRWVSRCENRRKSR